MTIPTDRASAQREELIEIIHRAPTPKWPEHGDGVRACEEAIADAILAAGWARTAAAPDTKMMQRLAKLLPTIDTLAQMLKPAGHEGDDEEGCDSDCSLCYHEQLMGAIESATAIVEDDAERSSSTRPTKPLLQVEREWNPERDGEVDPA